MSNRRGIRGRTSQCTLVYALLFVHEPIMRCYRNHAHQRNQKEKAVAIESGDKCKAVLVKRSDKKRSI